VEVRALADVAGLTAEWNALVDRVEATPFVRPDWIEPWHRAFGGGRLETLAARRNGRLVAVLPVLRRRNGSASSPTNWHTPAFTAAAEDDAARAAVVEALVDATPRAFTLGFVDEADPSLGQTRAAFAGRGYRILERTISESPFVATGGSYESYTSASISGKRLAELRRQRRKLEREVGPVSVDVRQGRDGFEWALAETLRLEASGWKGERGTAIVSRPDTRDFYTEVARRFADRGTLRLAFLRAGETAIAAELGIEEHGVFFDLKGGFDADYRSYAPGLLLAQSLIASCFARGLRRFEFLGDAEPFKLELAPELRRKRLLQAFARVAGLAGYTAHRFGRPLAKRVAGLTPS